MLKFNDFINESVRNLMKPKSEDEILMNFKNADTNTKKFMLRKIKKQKFYTTEDFYRFIKLYIDISTWNRIIKKGYGQNYYEDISDLVDILDKHELLKIFKAIIYHKSDKIVNESIKDLMKGKSEEETLDQLNKLDSNEMLRRSCKYGFLKGVIKSLERGADPRTQSYYPLSVASDKGYIDIVKILLQDPRVDPSVSDNMLIKWASLFKQKEIVKLLLQDKRVKDKLNREEIRKFKKQIRTSK